MNLRLNKFKKKVLIYILFCLPLLFICVWIPALRPPFLNILKQPLVLIRLIRREFGAIIYYHRNFLQNERLKNEIDLLKNKLNREKEIYLENTRLKDILSLKEESPYKLITARLIGRSPDTWSSSIVIDKGRHQGINDGMVAVNYLGIIGRVIQTEEFTSKILLISDPSLGISCLVQRSRQEGLVCGTLGNHLIMKYLTEDSDIEAEDVIITSGLNRTYPKGLLIGTVVDIGKEFSGLSRYAIIKPAVNLSSIEEVLIIVP